MIKCVIIHTYDLDKSITWHVITNIYVLEVFTDKPYSKSFE